MVPGEDQFPCAPIVFGMGQDVPYIDLVPVIVNRRDQPVFVPTDIEDGEPLHDIHAGKRPAQIIEVREHLRFDKVVPRTQRAFSVRMLRPKVHQDGFGDHMHQANYTNTVCARIRYAPVYP